MTDRRLFYETIADRFDSLANPFDLERRLEIIFEVLLPEDVSGRRVLDLGCGTGWFSQRARQRGAQVVSLDISRSLARLASQRAACPGVTADASLAPFPAQVFDLIISSEMIEHLEQPVKGLMEIERLLVPGGTVSLTTPNRRWLGLVKLATRFGLRPFEGYENFLGFDELYRMLAALGLEVEVQVGFHPWPFQMSFLQPLSRRVDRRWASSRWAGWMIHQAIRARKPVEWSRHG